MEILFRQKESGNRSPRSFLEEFGIEGCILKYISFEKDRSRITRKRHYHTNIEIHIIEKGYQVYEIGKETVRVESGQFLLIPPGVKHTTLTENNKTEKYAITLRLSEKSTPFALPVNEYLLGRTPAPVKENIRCISCEKTNGAAYCFLVISGRVFECVLNFLRLAGLKESFGAEPHRRETDERFLLASQYIDDNVRQNVSVAELASYCCISEKQLQRIFEREAGVSVKEYISKKRAIEIEKLLLDSTLSLRDVSEKMNFNNEYYFNAFFKKISGMTPGACRKSITKQ